MQVRVVLLELYLPPVLIGALPAILFKPLLHLVNFVIVNGFHLFLALYVLPSQLFDRLDNLTVDDLCVTLLHRRGPCGQAFDHMESIPTILG